jgi:RimJ/RimL family protein N-acetyltransferase
MHVETERLRIVPLNVDQLKLLKNNRMKLEADLGLKFSNMLIPDEVKREMYKSVDYWLENVDDHVDNYYFYTNWDLVQKDTNTSIGGFGFNGEPNENDELEIAYVIDEKQQNKGYMTEVIRAMTAWAFKNSDAQKIIASTPKDNYAAQKVLFKNSFERRNEDSKNIYWTLDRSDVEL